ncbi:hypothetical protein GC722_04730 [Auraticoccus sp. F435]|uniref:AbiEi antitoxin N-terminal domain-containing protein n=1 Tax=Auraticoccus cholistanensis TaxID=2656650 RepID=A0A6A9UR02_9ACTN|nr:hypothetical protein [Auraticoccus cholistanensis]
MWVRAEAGRWRAGEGRRVHARLDPGPQLADLAVLQAGVVSLEQARGHGLGRNSVARLVREGRWRPLGRGVYAVHAAEEPRWLGLAWAGVLVGGDGARLGGWAAAHLHGLAEPPPELEVWLPRDSRVRGGVGPWRFRHERPGTHRTTRVGDPPRLGVEDTLLDLLAELTPDEAVALLIRAVQTRRTTPDRVRRAAAERPRLRHRRLIAEVLAEVSAGVESPLERRYLHDVERAHGLRAGQRQQRASGSVRDVVYLDHGWWWSWTAASTRGPDASATCAGTTWPCSRASGRCGSAGRTSPSGRARRRPRWRRCWSTAAGAGSSAAADAAGPWSEPAAPDPLRLRSRSGAAAHVEASSAVRTRRGTTSTAASSSTATPVETTRTSCTAGESSSAGSAASPPPWPPSWVPTRALTTAPNTASPSALPIDRANITAPVTTPRSSQPTVDWAAISVGAAISPRPTPTPKQPAATCHTELCRPSGSIEAVPASASTAPISPVSRNPSRR